MSEEVAPKGWCVATIMDVAASSGGGTPSKSDPSYWDEGTIPWVSPKDMKSFLVTSSEDSVTTKALGRLTLIPSESVLVVVRSGILSRTLPVSINMIPVTVNQDMRAFVPAPGIDARFIAWQLVSKERDILDRCAKDGTTVASIEGPALAGYPMAIAPRNEQTRIVEKLEELLSDLDAGVAELKAAQRKLAQYRQSLLKAAVEGALTADWRAVRAQCGEPQETGAALLQRILTERRTRWETRQLAKFAEQGKTPPKGWQAKYPEPVAPDLTDLPLLPDGWVWASLDALIEDGPQNGLYLPANRYGRGMPILRIDDFQIGWHRERDALNRVQADASVADTFALKSGDIVINRVNSMTHLGKCLEIPALLDAALFESNMMRMRLHGSVSTSYVAFYLGSVAGRARLTKDAKWAVNQASINQQDVRRTPVPFPCCEEQVAIAEQLGLHHEAINAQLAAIDGSLKQSAAQRKNILKAAFAGQLVPQDPKDEPASALLERIRAAKMEHAGKAKPVGKRGRKA